MATGVSICSNALLMLGANTINSFDDDSDRAKTASNLWPSFVDSILRKHYWNCAKKQVVLSPDSEAPAFDWDYQFTLPSDWVRTLQVGKYRQPDDYEHVGRKLLMATNVLYLTYISNDATNYDTELVNVLELGMAARMAYAITQSASLRDSFAAEYRDALRIAKAIDGQDEPPTEFPDSPLLAARY
jgi:hypothetical protein